jgi:excisionase family DNA binding protein
MSTSMHVPPDLLLQMRKALPKHALTYGQALMVARHQAAQLRELLNIRTTRLPLGWVKDVANVELQVLTATEMEEIAREPASGLTRWNKATGRYLIAINKNMSVTHRRFSLAHELAHLITCTHTDSLYVRLGHGDPELRAYRIEGVCNHFAAHLLAPDVLLRKLWRLGIQAPDALAAEFGMSEDAINIRLRATGLVDDDRDRAVEEFFRRAVPPKVPPGSLPENDYREVQCPGALLTVDEACETLRISRWSLYSLIRRRQLRSVKIGSRRLIPAAAVQDLVDQLSDAEAV